MNKYELTVLIERYLDGEMTDSEAKEFEKDLKLNVELAKEFYLQKEIRSVIADKDIFEFREKLEEIRKNYNCSKLKSRNPVFIYSVVASFIAIALLSYYFFCYDSYSNYDLYDKYYKHVDSGIITRGTSNKSVNDFEIALSEYENGKYKEAISHFIRISDTSEYNISAKFFSAISYMELNQPEQAIILFADLENKTNTIYYEDVLWYDGLCLLKLNDSEAAKKRFEKLISINSTYKDRATEILKKIK